jgi:hypothetical protein
MWIKAKLFINLQDNEIAIAVAEVKTEFWI